MKVMQEVIIEQLDWDDYAAAALPQGQQYIVIGDVHECVRELLPS